MFVILVYDVNEKRVSKYLKLVRQYLTHIQRSVFEGEITAAQLKELKEKIKELMEEEEDSVVIYKFESKKYYERETLGAEVASEEDIIF